MTIQSPHPAAEFDADNDGAISYSERAGLIYPEDNLVIEEDIELGVNGFCDSSENEAKEFSTSPITGHVPVVHDSISLPELHP